MVENVMPHFVTHNETNFRQGGLLEKIVVERDAGGAEKTGHVRAWLLRLARGIELVNVGDRDFVRPRQRQNGIADLCVSQRFKFVEQRKNENWRNHRADDEE